MRLVGRPQTWAILTRMMPMLSVAMHCSVRLRAHDGADQGPCDRENGGVKTRRFFVWLGNCALERRAKEPGPESVEVDLTIAGQRL
jgi:hypothetical protein